MNKLKGIFYLQVYKNYQTILENNININNLKYKIHNLVLFLTLKNINQKEIKGIFY